jgi:DNA-directed RNA polymerase subunit RPC12/RpoP
MLEVAEKTGCLHCGHPTLKLYHNTVVPYCTNCNVDLYGNAVYKCNWCGKAEPSTRMETEYQCLECFRKETRE